MCRILSYLGSPTPLEELLYKPDNSFIKQSYNPKHMSHLLNLAGFGMVAWDDRSNNPQYPFYYKTPQLPFYDENLRNLASKISPHCLLAHLRGVSYNDRQVVSLQNVHPFMFDVSNVALAHNGALFDFEKMKFDLLEFIHPDYRNKIHGNTDSEWIYAIFLSHLPSARGHFETDDIVKALMETLKVLQRVRYKNNLRVNSPVNVFVTNGEFIAVTRFVFDYGWQPLDAEPSTHFTYHSLWYTYGQDYGYYDSEYKMKPGGKKTSVIIASEPLTEDATTWIEVPEYSLLVARKENDEINIVSRDINRNML